MGGVYQFKGCGRFGDVPRCVLRHSDSRVIAMVVASMDTAISIASPTGCDIAYHTRNLADTTTYSRRSDVAGDNIGLGSGSMPGTRQVL